MAQQARQHNQSGPAPINCVAPLTWRAPGGKAIGASVLFLDCGGGPFAVTADHVYQAYLDAKTAEPMAVARIGDAVFDMESRLIDRDSYYDLATFKAGAADIKRADIATGIMRVNESDWPPIPPDVGANAKIAGFPHGSSGLHEQVEISAIVEAVNDRDVSCLLSKERDGIARAGLSGAPMLVMDAKTGAWRLGGVVRVGGPETGIVKASSACHILHDGRLKHRLLKKAPIAT